MLAASPSSSAVEAPLRAALPRAAPLQQHGCPDAAAALLTGLLGPRLLEANPGKCVVMSGSALARQRQAHLPRAKLLGCARAIGCARAGAETPTPGSSKMTQLQLNQRQLPPSQCR